MAILPGPTFIVEDGSGSNPGANSYVSVADADTYHANTGSPALWTDTVGSGVLTLATNPNNAETITIGSVVYILLTGALGATNDVKIGASVADTLRNLAAAINLTGDKGSWYHTSTVVHPTVSAVASANSLAVTAKTGGSASNSIVTQESMSQYENIWAATTLLGGYNSREGAIRLATAYLDMTYGQRWVERRTNDEQALHWPRAFVEDGDGFAVESDVIPVQIKNATSYLALKVLEGDTLMPDIIISGQNIQSSRVSVGTIEKEVTYKAGTGKAKVKTYDKVVKLVDEFLEPTGRIYLG